MLSGSVYYNIINYYRYIVYTMDITEFKQDILLTYAAASAHQVGSALLFNASLGIIFYNVSCFI